MKLTDDVKQRKQKHFKQYRTAKQKLTNKENLVRFLHRGKPQIPRDPFHLKENARTDVNIENRKRKGLKFCNITAILNNSDNAGVVSNPAKQLFCPKDQGQRQTALGLQS